MQTKIKTFFKLQSHSKAPNEPQLADQTDHLFLSPNKEPQISVKEQRRASTAKLSYVNSEIGSQQIQVAPRECSSIGYPLKPTSVTPRILNKKRSYAQLHLDLGQSDFLLHTCSVCGFIYARGNKEDEKVHKYFHKDYTQGIQFKGWHNERVIHMLLSTEAGRIILVLDGDPPSHNKKVQKVVELMEMELGTGWLIHKHCKVYLFISCQRIAGCLIAEPIKNAYKVLSNSTAQRSPDATHPKKNKSKSSILQFGDINFKREAIKIAHSLNNHGALEDYLTGAIFCEKEAVPALCGIRAIWVASALRRKHIASRLLDAARMSFCKDFVLKASQLAFSELTHTGKVLPSTYCDTAAFLVYKTDVNEKLPRNTKVTAIIDVSTWSWPAANSADLLVLNRSIMLSMLPDPHEALTASLVRLVMEMKRATTIFSFTALCVQDMI